MKYLNGYGLIVKTNRAGAYKYFADLGDHMEVVESKTAYVDKEREAEADKREILFGMTLGATGEEEDSMKHGFGARSVAPGSRAFYTAEEIKSFCTLGLSSGIKLLGFKDLSELAFEDNVKHSVFLQPDETNYSGSKRTFSALVTSMIKKKKFALVLGMPRSNSSPTFYAMIAQAEKFEDGAWVEPAGMHLIPLPFADDIREAPIDEGFIVSRKELTETAQLIVKRLELRGQKYIPESYPNPALAFHNAQLEASAFREEYDPDSFKDLTLPSYSYIQKKTGSLIHDFKKLLRDDSTAHSMIVTAGSKRKADVSVDETEVRSKYEAGTLNKLLNDQLKEFLKSKSLSVSGKKSELIERVSEWLEKH